jgi:N-acetylglutamate synthase
MFSRDEVETIERAAARAWPARETRDIDGWLWRGSGGGSRRANSVVPWAFRGQDVDAAIDRIEALYRGQGTRSYVQVTSIAVPDDLDQRLAARGYTFEEPCVLMAKRLIASPMPQEVEVTAEPTADWLSIYTEPLDAARRAAAPAVLASVPPPRAFFLLRRDGVPLSTALGVAAPDGIAIVECVATRSTARRSGGARVIMDALEAWCVSHGAQTAALQVVAENKPARELYARRGYEVAGTYHYRWRDV